MLIFIFAIFACTQAVFTTIQTPAALKPGRNEVTIMHQNRKRTAVVFIPTVKNAPSDGLPLVMMLHGAGGSTANVIESTGWNEVGEREGFITVFPNGTPKKEGKKENFRKNPQTWNSGAGSSLAAGNESAIAKNVDDVGFLSALLAYVQQHTPVNRKKIYVCGHSNGAGMAYRFALERSDLVAGVGAMAGHFFQEASKIEYPVPLLQIIGDQDPFVPMQGGMAGVGRNKMEVPPALDSPERWAKLQGISRAAKIVKDDEKVTERLWGPSSCGAEVKSIVVKGHGHTYLWQSKGKLPAFLVGPTVHSINATETFWAFFKKYTKLDKC